MDRLAEQVVVRVVGPDGFLVEVAVSACSQSSNMHDAEVAVFKRSAPPVDPWLSGLA